MLLFQPCPDFHWNQVELGLRRVDFDVGSAGREGRGLHRLGREHWLGSAIRDFFPLKLILEIEITTKCPKDVKFKIIFEEPA